MGGRSEALAPHHHPNENTSTTQEANLGSPRPSPTTDYQGCLRWKNAQPSGWQTDRKPLVSLHAQWSGEELPSRGPLTINKAFRFYFYVFFPFHWWYRGAVAHIWAVFVGVYILQGILILVLSKFSKGSEGRKWTKELPDFFVFQPRVFSWTSAVLPVVYSSLFYFSFSLRNVHLITRKKCFLSPPPLFSQALVIKRGHY